MSTTNEVVYVNTKASNRARDRFTAKFPMATFIGSATLGSKRKTYRLPKDVWDANKEEIRKYATLQRK